TTRRRATRRSRRRQIAGFPRSLIRSASRNGDRLTAVNKAPPRWRGFFFRSGFLGGVPHVAHRRLGGESGAGLGPGDALHLAHGESAIGERARHVGGRDELVKVVPALGRVTLVLPFPDDLGKGFERLIVGEEAEAASGLQRTRDAVERLGQIVHVLER